jgi:hypothetical protein
VTRESFNSFPLNDLYQRFPLLKKWEIGIPLKQVEIILDVIASRTKRKNKQTSTSPIFRKEIYIDGLRGEHLINNNTGYECIKANIKGNIIENEVVISFETLKKAAAIYIAELSS